jgi:hypothetical protein
LLGGSSLIAGLFLVLPAYTILPTGINVISRLETGGKVIGCSFLLGGICLLAMGFIQWRLSVKSHQTNAIEDNGLPVQREAWKTLLRRGEILLTNRDNYAEQCIDYLLAASVPSEGYRHLIVWSPHAHLLIYLLLME